MTHTLSTLPAPPALPDWPATRAAFARGDLLPGMLANMLEDVGDGRAGRVRAMKARGLVDPKRFAEPDPDGNWHYDVEAFEAATDAELRRRVLALLGG